MDETGAQMDGLTGHVEKVFAGKSERYVAREVCGETKTNITTCMTLCNDGSYLPPFNIYQIGTVSKPVDFKKTAINQEAYPEAFHY